jgi:transposase-like protein
MRYLYLDGFSVKVRVAGRCSRVSVLAAVGVDGSGAKSLVGLWLKGSESAQAWGDALEDMIGRGLKAPLLVIIDGNPGLRRAIEECWPGAAIQRCTVHKLRNLIAILPKHAHNELKTDYRRIVNAFGLAEARVAYKRFVTKWRTLSEGVVKSLEEAGAELLTFYYFPKTQWKSLRSTNVIERLYGEFRRRVKTQGALPTEDAILALLYGLVATGQIVMRKITGYEDMPRSLPAELDKAA